MQFRFRNEKLVIKSEHSVSKVPIIVAWVKEISERTVSVRRLKKTTAL